MSLDSAGQIEQYDRLRRGKHFTDAYDGAPNVPFSELGWHVSPQGTRCRPTRMCEKKQLSDPASGRYGDLELGANVFSTQ